MSENKKVFRSFSDISDWVFNNGVYATIKRDVGQSNTTDNVIRGGKSTTQNKDYIPICGGFQVKCRKEGR